MMPTSRIKFNPSSPEIILITYPPGGFGNFIYFLLTEFTDQTVKPNNSQFEFSPAGNSHSTKKYTVTYLHNPPKYHPYIDRDVDTKDKKILVLVDNKWHDNDYSKLLSVFPNSKIVRMCSDPSIYNIIAAMVESKTANVPVNLRHRENYDGAGMFMPFTHQQVANVAIKEFMLDPVETFYKLARDLGLTVIRTEQLHQIVAEWRLAHKPYFIELYKEFQKEHLL